MVPPRSPASRAPGIIGEVTGLGVDMSCALKSLQGMLYKEPFPLNCVLR